MTVRDISFGSKVGLSILSDKWYMLVLQFLTEESKPFMAVRNAIRDISTFNLLIILSKLESMKLLSSEDYEYQLTSDGVKAQALISQIEQFGNQEVASLSDDF